MAEAGHFVFGNLLEEREDRQARTAGATLHRELQTDHRVPKMKRLAVFTVPGFFTVYFFVFTNYRGSFSFNALRLLVEHAFYSQSSR